MEDLEIISHNNTKMYEAVKNINRRHSNPYWSKEKTVLLTEQAKIVVDHFRSTSRAPSQWTIYQKHQWKCHLQPSRSAKLSIRKGNCYSGWSPNIKVKCKM